MLIYIYIYIYVYILVLYNIYVIFARIFRIPGTLANLQHLIFFSFLDDLLMFLEKSEVIFPFL